MNRFTFSRPLKIGHIGHGGHGVRIQHVIRRVLDQSVILNYDHHASFGYLPYIPPDIIKSDCLFISSPTSTHLAYLEALRNYDFQGYIYCEKPGLDQLEHATRFKECITFFSGRIHIGYHRPYSCHHQKISELINKSGFGIIRSFSIHEGFGLSYSPSFAISWRGRDPLAISSVGLSHILSSFIFFFPDLQPSDFDVNVVQNKENKTWDTANIYSRTGLPYFLHGSYSWGTPSHEYIRIISSNSIIDVNSSDLTLFSPRDYFDSSHLYSTPPRKNIKLPRQTIDDSIIYFLDHVNRQISFRSSNSQLACEISIRCLIASQIFC